MPKINKKSLSISKELEKEINDVIKKNPSRFWSDEETELLEKYKNQTTIKGLREILSKFGYDKSLDSISSKLRRQNQ